MRFRSSYAVPIVGAGLAVALTVTQVAAAEVGPPELAVTPTEVAAVATATADRVDPGFYEPATPPSFAPYYPDEPGAGVVTFEGVAEPVTIGATTTSGTPVTVGTSSLQLSHCEQAGPGLPCTTVNFKNRTEASGATVLTGAGVPSAVVQTNTNEIRWMALINKSSDPARYSYALTGGKFEMVEDAIVAVNTAGEVVGTVTEPWARDANGAEVETSYSVDVNGILTLHVDHYGAAYPVVADPKVTFGWYIYVRYSKAEVQRTYTQVTEYGYRALPAFMCGMVGSVSGWIGAAACAATLGVYASSVASAISTARKRNECFELKFTYNGWIAGWRPYAC